MDAVGVRRRTLGGIAAVLLLAAGRGTSASPFPDPTTTRAPFTGAATSSPGASIVNPAALATDPLSSLYLGGAWTFDDTAITPGGASDADQDRAHSGGLDVSTTSHPQSRVTLQVLFTTPPSERFFRAPAGSPLRYHSLGGGERDYVVAAGAAIRITPSVFVGLSASWVRPTLHLRFARDSALAAGRDPDRGIGSSCGAAACGIGNPLADERYDIHVAPAELFSFGSVAISLGALVRIIPDLWLGLGYHAPPGFADGGIQTTLSGKAAIEAAPRDGGGHLTSNAVVYLSQAASVDGEMRYLLRPYGLELHLAARWAYTERLDAYDVRIFGVAGGVAPPGATQLPEGQRRVRALLDSLAIWGGVDQLDTGQPWRLGARVGVATAGVAYDATSPMSPLGTALFGSLAVNRRLGSAWSLQISSDLGWQIPRNVTGSRFDPQVRLDCADSGENYESPACALSRDGFDIGSADGDYHRLDLATRMGLRYDFQ